MRRMLTLMWFLALVTVAPLRAQTAVQIQLLGTVFDSVTMRPLSGALVRLVRVDDPAVGRSAVADSTGAFRISEVPQGAWLATFLHPVLDSLRLEPGEMRLDLQKPGTIPVAMATPSVATLAVLACRQPVLTDEGLLVGSVRGTPGDSTLANVQIEVGWPEWILDGTQLKPEQRTKSARTDSLGRYQLCGVPRGTLLHARSFRGVDSTGQIELAVPAEGYAMQDFLLPSAPAGRATVRGRVTRENAQPLRNAIVRVLESGTTTRTGEDGSFVIADAGAGTRTLEARLIGFTPQRRAVELRKEMPTTVTLALPVQRVQLDTVRVVAGRELPYYVRAIERRARSGTGQLLSGDLVREHSSMWVTDALRGMNGVRVTTDGMGGSVQMLDFRGEVCRPMIYIDGTIQQIGGRTAASISIDDFVSRADVSAVEVYTRANRVPPEFAGASTACGVIAVWSRYATGNVPIVSRIIDKHSPTVPR